MTDLLFGAADNYTWEQICPWAKSIRESGFEGDVILLVYRGDIQEIAQQCAKYDISVFNTTLNSLGQSIDHTASNRDTQSHQMRFFHLWQLLSGSQYSHYRFVITTDVRDVVFQRNPIEFLETRLGGTGGSLLAPSEGIRYCDEPWGADNVRQGFGHIVFAAAEKYEIFNVGTIAGTAGSIRDLSLLLYSMGEGRFIPNDQSSFNLLVNGDLLDVTRANHDDGWACQCGTTADPQKIDGFRSKLLTPEPTFDNDGYAYTSKGEKFFLLHQYDRVPTITDKIVERYA